MLFICQAHTTNKLMLTLFYGDIYVQRECELLISFNIQKLQILFNKTLIESLPLRDICKQCCYTII